MSVCARAVQQADGTLLLALDPTVTDFSTCPYLVDDGASNAWRELGSMSLSDAQTIAFAVGVMWTSAWAFKVIGRAVGSASNQEGE